MKSAPFEYARAASIEEACELMHRHGDAAKLIAGGQSLVPMMAAKSISVNGRDLETLVATSRVHDAMAPPEPLHVTTRDFPPRQGCGQTRLRISDRAVSLRLPIEIAPL